MSKDPRDIRHRCDEGGATWLIDSNGNDVRDDQGERIPGPAEQKKTPSGFTHYDSSRGHCGLCGRLTCSGNCFK